MRAVLLILFMPFRSPLSSPPPRFLRRLHALPGYPLQRQIREISGDWHQPPDEDLDRGELYDVRRQVSSDLLSPQISRNIRKNAPTNRLVDRTRTQISLPNSQTSQTHIIQLPPCCFSCTSFNSTSAEVDFGCCVDDEYTRLSRSRSRYMYCNTSRINYDDYVYSSEEEEVKGASDSRRDEARRARVAKALLLQEQGQRGENRRDAGKEKKVLTFEITPVRNAPLVFLSFFRLYEAWSSFLTARGAFFSVGLSVAFTLQVVIYEAPYFDPDAPDSRPATPEPELEPEPEAKPEPEGEAKPVGAAKPEEQPEGAAAAAGAKPEPEEEAKPAAAAAAVAAAGAGAGTMAVSHVFRIGQAPSTAVAPLAVVPPAVRPKFAYVTLNMGASKDKVLAKNLDLFFSCRFLQAAA